MQKRMLALKALRPHLYGTRRLEAGDEYEAPVEEAIALVASRKADFVKAKKPAAPVAAAPPAPMPSVPRYEPEPADTPPDIDDLRRQATQLGVNIDGRWGIARLQHEIDEARQR